MKRQHVRGPAAHGCLFRRERTGVPQTLIWGLVGAAAVLPRATAAWRAGAGSRATTPTGVLPFSKLVRVKTQVPRGEGMGGEGLAMAVLDVAGGVSADAPFL